MLLVSISVSVSVSVGRYVQYLKPKDINSRQDSSNTWVIKMEYLVGKYIHLHRINYLPSSVRCRDGPIMRERKKKKKKNWITSKSFAGANFGLHKYRLFTT